MKEMKMKKTSLFLSLALSVSPFALQAQEAIAVPASNEGVSLEQFDEMFSNLDKDLETKIKAPNTEEDDLPDPDLSASKSKLDGMSASQANIEHLKIKVQEAELQSQLNQILIEAKANQYQDQIDELNADLAAISERLEVSEASLQDAEQTIADLRDENERLQASGYSVEEINDLISRNEALEMQLAEAEVAGGGSVNSPVSGSLPQVEAISGIGQNRAAKVVLPSGGVITVRVGDKISHNVTVSQIDAREVFVEVDGDERPLSFVRRAAEGDDEDNQDTSSFDILEDAALDANG